MAELKINQIQRIGKASFTRDIITIGRAKEADITIAHNSISREHCVIEKTDGAPKIRDLGSTHGTKINGRRITGETPLYHDDRIGVGTFELLYLNPQSVRPAPPVEIDIELDLEGSPAGDDASDGSGAPASAESDEVQRLKQLASQLKAQLAEKEQQLAGLDMRLDDATGQATDHEQRARELEATLAETREEAERAATESEASRAEMQEQVDKAHKDHQSTHAELEKISGQLSTTSGKLEHALQQIAALMTEVKESKASEKDAHRRVETIESLMGTLRAEAQQVFAASKKLTAIHQGLQALEAVYVETNELVEVADESNPEAFDQALAQQESVGHQLEAIHVHRDEASEQLQQLVEEFCRALISDPAYQPSEDGNGGKRSLLSRLTGT